MRAGEGGGGRRNLRRTYQIVGLDHTQRVDGIWSPTALAVAGRASSHRRPERRRICAGFCVDGIGRRPAMVLLAADADGRPSTFLSGGLGLSCWTVPGRDFELLQASRGR